MRNQQSLLLCLMLAGLTWMGLGCQPGEESVGSAHFVGHIQQALSASDVTRVSVTVSAADMATRTVGLVKVEGQWTGTLGQLPAGVDRTFLAEAFGSDGTKLYAGHATGITIIRGKTTLVALTLQQVAPPPPFANAVPIIDSLVSSASALASGESVTLRATAHDPNPGDVLIYAWTASAGVLGSPSHATTTWTAPETSGPVTLRLVVTDPHGSSSTLSLAVTVRAGRGSAHVDVSLNTWPQVAGLIATPSRPEVGQPTTVVATATDNDGDALSWQWSASGCTGNWTEATTATARFTPQAVPPGGSCDCHLGVTVTDGRGGQAQGTLSICVGPEPTALFAPEITETFQSTDSVSAGGTAVFRVRAVDPQGSPVSFSWSANTGTLSTPSSTAEQTEVVWTAPSCTPEGTTPTLTATATNAHGLSSSTAFSVLAQTACNPFVAVASGNNTYSLALKQDGTVWSWGFNGNGQLGDGTLSSRFTPVPVANLTHITALAPGNSHTLALKQDGTVWAWGFNGNSELGDGTTTDRLSPVKLAGLTQIIGVTAGVWHGMALKQDGTVWAWGNGVLGQLGDGTTLVRTTPVRVPSLTNVLALSAGLGHSLALKQDGTVWAWGNNTEGQLGDGTTTTRLTPVQVQGLGGVKAIFAGALYSLALKQDGTVWAWGSNAEGQLGDGTLLNRHVPQRVSGLEEVTTLSAGARYILALKQDGTVWSWGENNRGQLGDGTTTTRTTPVPVANLTQVVGLSAGKDHALAVKRDGSVWAWGYNNSGALGDDAPVNFVTTPIRSRKVTP